MSNKHKHYDMIVAKASNMDLVQFIKMDGEWENAGLSDKFISFSEGYDYFLCLPQHKEACLHWLNGGDVEFFECEKWHQINSKIKWGSGHLFMGEFFKIRIKPRIEKRWICITDSLEIEDGTLYESLEDANENSPGYKQIVEIEVEV